MSTETWIPVDPADYDEPHEVEGLELAPNSFVSPFDVPDGVRRVSRGTEGGGKIEFRYLTDLEKSELWKESEERGIQLWTGVHSRRLIRLEITISPPPTWDELEAVLTKWLDAMKRTNHYVVRAVLHDFWSELWTSDPKASTIAGKVLGGKKPTLSEAKKLAASVLSQGKVHKTDRPMKKASG
ncbi:MAG: hypothetical protein OXQ94_09560 [Gemmatimonadota bacterium]|nr:hypothetical protein [Gemmatimonadota bacterium]